MYWISEEVISCNKYLSALLFRQFDTFTSNTIYCHFFTKVCTCGIKASGQWLISDRSVVPKKVYILLQKRMFIIYVTPVAFHIFVVIKKRLKKKRQTSNQQNLDNLQNALWLRSQTTLARNISYSSAPPFTEIPVFIYDLFCGIIEGLIKIIRQCENTTW